MDNTLSILPSDGASNEFPVLKAFQQYIDAEQAKARKRMLGLSVFFIILLVVVVVTFVLVLTTVVNRNQALSDRLLDYALKEREKPKQRLRQRKQLRKQLHLRRPRLRRHRFHLKSSREQSLRRKIWQMRNLKTTTKSFPMTFLQRDSTNFSLIWMK